MCLHNHQMHLVEPSADDDYMGGTCNDLGCSGFVRCECLHLAVQCGCVLEQVPNGGLLMLEHHIWHRDHDLGTLCCANAGI